MKLSKHKLPTQDLELLITNLHKFIVKVEEDKALQEYNMWSFDECVYSKTIMKGWSPNNISQMLLQKDYYLDSFDNELEHTSSKLFDKAFNLFTEIPFDKKGYDYYHLTKQQWLEVANKVVLKLENKLWKRKLKDGIKTLEGTTFVPTTWEDVTVVFMGKHYL